MTPVLLALLLTGPLEMWRLEIEKTGPQSVTMLRLTPGEPPPEDTANRAILLTFTENPNFQQQFGRAQALSITQQSRNGPHSFILLNTKQTPPEDEPYVIAHELGHLWLKAQKYPAPAYTGGPSSCLSILTGDAVQHVLIRAEMDRRNIEWREPWMRSLRAALAMLEAEENPPAPNRCQALVQTILWIDVKLGLTDAQFPERRRMLDLLSTRFPVIQPVAAELATQLKQEKLDSKPAHERMLQLVFTRLKQMAMTLPN